MLCERFVKTISLPWHPGHSVRPPAGGNPAGDFESPEIDDRDIVVGADRHVCDGSVRRNENAGAAAAEIDAVRLSSRSGIDRDKVACAEIGNEYGSSVGRELKAVRTFGMDVQRARDLLRGHI